MEFVIWKFVKYMGLAIFAAALGMTIWTSDRKRSWLAASWGLGLGFLLLWLAGYGMAKAMAYPLSRPWIGISQAASCLSLIAAFWIASGRRSQLWASIALAAFTLSIGAMVFRDAIQSLGLILVIGLALLCGLGWFRFRNSSTIEADSTDLGWFSLIAWLEGLSLIALFFVYMPFKYAFGIVLDQGQGWFGWVHGLFQIAYLLALLGILLAGQLSRKEAVLGAIASLLPGGTFYFERKLRQATAH